MWRGEEYHGTFLSHVSPLDTNPHLRHLELAFVNTKGRPESYRLWKQAKLSEEEVQKKVLANDTEPGDSEEVEAYLAILANESKGDKKARMEYEKMIQVLHPIAGPSLSKKVMQEKVVERIERRAKAGEIER